MPAHQTRSQQITKVCSYEEKIPTVFVLRSTRSKLPYFRKRRSSPNNRSTSGIRPKFMTGRCPALAGGITLAAGFLVLFLTGGTRHAIGLVLNPMADAFGWEREAIGAAVAVSDLPIHCRFTRGSVSTSPDTLQRARAERRRNRCLGVRDRALAGHRSIRNGVRNWCRSGIATDGRRHADPPVSEPNGLRQRYRHCRHGPRAVGHHHGVVLRLGGCGMASGLYLARYRKRNIGTVCLLGPKGTRQHQCGAPGGSSHLWIIRGRLTDAIFLAFDQCLRHLRIARFLRLHPCRCLRARSGNRHDHFR